MATASRHGVRQGPGFEAWFTVALGLTTGLAVATACGAPEAAKPPEAVQTHPTGSSAITTHDVEVPLPELRAGALPASLRDAVLELPIHSFFRGAGFEIVGLTLPLEQRAVRRIQWIRLTSAGLAGATTGPLFTAGTQAEQHDGPSLWALVPSARGASLDGTLVLTRERQAGELIRFRASGALPLSRQAALTTWAEVLSDRYRQVPTAYHQFASDRLLTTFTRQLPPTRTEIETTTTELLEALMTEEEPASKLTHKVLHSSRFWKRGMNAPRRVALGTLSGPDRLALPFDQWLPEAGGEVESLAAFAPRDFYYLRARSPRLLFSVSDDEHFWNIREQLGLQPRFERGLFPRYLAELGLTPEKVAALSQGVVGDVALVGSDVSFQTGSDVSVLFALNDPARFESVLGMKLTAEIDALTDVPARALLAPRVAVLSNSKTALARIRAVATGNAPALAGDASFRYLAAHTPSEGHDDLLGFISEPFIQAYDSPARRIAHARRALLGAELQIPALARVLYSELTGRAPTRRELRGLGLLQQGEHRHFDGRPIRFEGEEPPTSVYGTNTRLVPLLDLPAPSTITEFEKNAYTEFKQSLELGGATFRGPLLMRLDLKLRESSVEGIRFRIHTVPVSPEYAAYASLTHNRGVRAAELKHGARIAAVLSPIEMPFSVSRLLQQWLGSEVELEWLGNWAALGVEDRNSFAWFVHETLGAPELPSSEVAENDVSREQLIQRILRDAEELPLYLVLQTRSSAGTPASAASTLSALGFVQQHSAETSNKGIATWRLVKPGLCGAHACTFSLYTKERGNLTFVATNSATLERQLAANALADGNAEDPQLNYQLDSSNGNALRTVLEWLTEQGRRDASLPSRELANVLYAAAPDAKKEQRYVTFAERWLGEVPTTAEGSPYGWAPDGLLDLLRGTLASPAWPELPIEGTGVHWLELLTHAEIRVRFVVEGNVGANPVHGVLFEGSLGHRRARP